VGAVTAKTVTLDGFRSMTAHWAVVTVFQGNLPPKRRPQHAWTASQGSICHMKADGNVLTARLTRTKVCEAKRIAQIAKRIIIPMKELQNAHISMAH
jgi:hypothetical protein